MSDPFSLTSSLLYNVCLCGCYLLSNSWRMADKTKIVSLIFLVMGSLVNTPLGLCWLTRYADDTRHQAVLCSILVTLCASVLCRSVSATHRQSTCVTDLVPCVAQLFFQDCFWLASMTKNYTPHMRLHIWGHFKAPSQMYERMKTFEIKQTENRLSLIKSKSLPRSSFFGTAAPPFANSNPLPLVMLSM